MSSDLTMRLPLPRERDGGCTAEYRLGTLPSPTGYGLFLWETGDLWVHSRRCPSINRVVSGVQVRRDPVGLMDAEAVTRMWEVAARRGAADPSAYPALMFCRRCVCVAQPGTEEPGRRLPA